MLSIVLIISLLGIVGYFVYNDLMNPPKEPVLDPNSTNPDDFCNAAERMYAKGNTTESRELYIKAANMGSIRACIALTNDSPEIAFKWRLKAAELNHRASMVWVINAYITGHGVLKSIAKSTQWLIRAAEAGDTESMIKLSAAYTSGYGVGQNIVEGLAWLYVAEFKGNQDAKAAMKRGEGDLNPGLIHAAQERAQVILDLLNAGKSTVDSVDYGAGNLPQPTRPAAIKPDRKPIGSGSGAIVSPDGHVVTAAHVLKNASYIEVVTSNGAKQAAALSVDNHNDVALLKIEGPFENSIPIGRASEVRLGQTVSTIGFPNIGIQGQSPKVTQGMISGDNGMQNDIRFWQISVPIQPGNSGGPLLNEKGELVGVIVATLSLESIKITGTVPQNVNYAIKGNYLEPMLQVHKVTCTTGTSKSPNFQDMIAQAQKSSVLILVY